MAPTTDLALLERFSAQMMATARRYSETPDDAEDAYQRAAEILLKRRSEPPGEDMCRWLRTTVKHEALAIRRSRERMVPLGGPDRVPEPPGAQPDTEERAERFERLRLGAQALRSLKPQEIRCLALRAEGYTYNEICELTGFSYTKVDRCLKEGRAAFAARVARIESGDECSADRTGAVRAGRRRGERRGPGRRPAPPPRLPALPGEAARVPRGALAGGGADAAGRARGRRRRRGAAALARGVRRRRRAGPGGRAGRPRPPGGRAGGRPEGGGGGGLGGGAGRRERGARRAPRRERREGAFACGANGAAEARPRAGAARRHAHAAARTHPGASARAGSRSRPERRRPRGPSRRTSSRRTRRRHPRPRSGPPRAASSRRVEAPRAAGSSGLRRRVLGSPPYGRRQSRQLASRPLPPPSGPRRPRPPSSRSAPRPSRGR